jgi:hypothetical protein
MHMGVQWGYDSDDGIVMQWPRLTLYRVCNHKSSICTSIMQAKSPKQTFAIPHHYLYLRYLYTPFPFPCTLQIHSNSHTITMDQQRRREPTTQDLEITNIGQTLGLALIGALEGRGEGGEDDGGVFGVVGDELVED